MIMIIPKACSGKTAEIECPEFIGQNYEEIINNKQYTDEYAFEFEAEWDNNPEFEKGEVYEQSEKPGKKLKKGAKITLYISMGQSTKKVPDLNGMSESAAISALKAQGFKYETQTRPSADVEKGHVIETNPVRTTIVAEDTVIILYISEGAPETKNPVPNVVGMKSDAAKTKLEDEGFVVKPEEVYIEYTDKYYPVGTVVAQNPENSSKEYDEGTKVTIKVCKGYKYDVEVSLPMDFSKKFYLSLYTTNGKISTSNELDSTISSNYTFKGIKSENSVEQFVVQISVDKKTEYKYCKITIDRSKGTVNFDDSIADYPFLFDVESEPEDTNESTVEPDSGAETQVSEPEVLG